MAINADKRKKRLKRQLKKRVKQTPKVIETGGTDETVQPAPTITDYGYTVHMLYQGKYDEENAQYQVKLDKEYFGSVKPVERFINYRANILHYCSDCTTEFYSKPILLLTRENQRHICGVDLGKLGDTKRSRRVITDEVKAQMVELSKQGMSNSKIASTLGVSRPTVINHLRKVGLK
jgi:hypothetical protein